MTLTATNDCGSNTETQQISVACTPPQVSISANGSTQICPGEMVILQINGGNFATFQWYRNGAEIAGANGSSFVAVDAGVYKIFVTDALDCGNFSNEMTVEISQFPAAVITSSSPYGSVCVGASTWLRGVGGDDYQWITPSGLLIGGQEIQIPVANFVSGGIYFLTVTNGAGCAETASFTLSVLPTPQVFILGLATNYTDQDLAVTLVGNPLGGIFPGRVFCGAICSGGCGHWATHDFIPIYGCERLHGHGFGGGGGVAICFNDDAAGRHPFNAGFAQSQHGRILAAVEFSEKQYLENQFIELHLANFGVPDGGTFSG